MRKEGGKEVYLILLETPLRAFFALSSFIRILFLLLLLLLLVDPTLLVLLTSCFFLSFFFF